MPCFVLINSVFSFEPFVCLPFFSAFIPWLIMVCCTLRASLSDTFLQTLPDFVTPSFFHVALRPWRRYGLLWTGTEREGDDRVKARQRKPPEKDQLHLPPLRSLDLLISPGTPIRYATEGALFISMQLSTNVVIMQRPPKGLGTDKTVVAT